MTKTNKARQERDNKRTLKKASKSDKKEVKTGKITLQKNATSVKKKQKQK